MIKENQDDTECGRGSCHVAQIRSMNCARLLLQAEIQRGAGHLPHASSFISRVGNKLAGQSVVDRTIAILSRCKVDEWKEENRVGSAGARPMKEIESMYAEMKRSRRRERLSAKCSCQGPVRKSKS